MAQHPTEEILNITRKFLGGEMGVPDRAGPSQVPRGDQVLPRETSRLPSQAAPIARSRAFGQQGARQRRGREDLIRPFPTSPFIPPTGIAPTGDRAGSLSDRFFNLSGPAGFAQTPQGRALLQRILGLRGLR
jgi:hypothetical protein